MRFISVLGLAATAVVAVSAPVSADPILTSDPVLTAYTLQYGDFQVVSLAFANEGTGTNNYYVASSPGQLRDVIVVGTHAGGGFYNGSTGSASNPLGIDSAYATPNPGGASYFRTGNATSSPDPGSSGEFAGDTANSWDISLSMLKTYLNGSDMVFYFNLNETGVNDTLSGTDLLFYMKVSLKNSSTGASQDFYLAGNPFDGLQPPPSHAGADAAIAALGQGPDETLSYPDVSPGATYDPADVRWTYVHGNICVNGSTFVHYGNCVGGDPAGSTSVKQNLGENQAAFAGYNSVLSDLINHSSLYDTMSIDWRMADQDNGYEQLFILASGDTRTVPEPVTIGLFGAGLAGLGLLRRRKAKKA